MYCANTEYRGDKSAYEIYTAHEEFLKKLRTV